MKIKKVSQTPGLVATVVDNLISTSTIDALSANQGRILNNKITAIEEEKEEYGLIHSGEMTNGSIGGQAGKYYVLTFKNTYSEPPTVITNFYSKSDIGYYGFVMTQVVALSNTQCTLVLNVQGLSGTTNGISYIVKGK